MRSCSLAILGILFSIQYLFAQNEPVTLLLQSPDGKNVKLLWFPKNLNNISGYDVKRKEGLQEWVKLNSEPITAGISMKRNFSPLGVNKSEENILKARLYKMLASHKLIESDAQGLQKLFPGEKGLEELKQKIANDYEVALMYGFAYTDHTVTTKTDYQYGLFVQDTNKLVAKVLWNYGEVPDLNTVSEITSRSTIGNSGVQVIWNADLKKVTAGNVAGFNIYRQGIRLNTHPIAAPDLASPGEFSWFDRSANSAIPIQYSISAESVFGIEGIIRSYTYNPADHPTEYKKTDVTEISSVGYYFKDGISVKWNFPKEHERFIKGFYVEKENMPNGYNRVSSLLEQGTRSFVDKTPSPTSVYIRMRIIAVYNDRTMEPGRERIYSYFPISEPPAPGGFNASILPTNKKIVIQLTWDHKLAGDSTTDHYKVYVNEPGNDKFSAVNDDPSIVGNNYLYRVQSEIATRYKFYLTAVSRSGVESAPTDTVSILAPSSELPPPGNFKVTPDSNRVLIQWQYPDIADLKGFLLYQNNAIVRNEKDLPKKKREVTITDLQKATSFEFTLRALSESGVISEFSERVTISVPPMTNK